jgi:hypothetical protein
MQCLQRRKIIPTHALVSLLFLRDYFYYTQMTQPLVDYYGTKGDLQTFQGTKSDVIYPQVKVWLKERGF